MFYLVVQYLIQLFLFDYVFGLVLIHKIDNPFFLI